MATKKKTRSRNQAAIKRPTQKTTSPPKKQARPRKTAKPISPAVGSFGTKLLSEGVPLQCPSHVYDGIVLGPNRTVFLRAAGGTYLMLLDPDCSGVYSPGRVDAAYATFSQNPGGSQRLVCNGFLHEDGSALVPHVVN